MSLIYHLTAVSDWEAGKTSGTYTTSTHGKTLKEVAFLHGSQAGQVANVAYWLHKGTGEDLIVLVIDTDKLTSRGAGHPPGARWRLVAHYALRATPP